MDHRVLHFLVKGVYVRHAPPRRGLLAWGSIIYKCLLTPRVLALKEIYLYFGI